MSFSYRSKTLRSGNTYDSSAPSEMSAHGKEVTGGTEIGTIDENEENNVRFSTEMFDDRIKADLETLHAQIFALTQMMDRLIQGNLAMEFNAARTRDLRNQPELLFTGTPGTSGCSTAVPLNTAGYRGDRSNPNFTPKTTTLTTQEYFPTETKGQNTRKIGRDMRLSSTQSPRRLRD